MKINIYLVEQNIVNGYDTYDSFVCYANNEEEARHMNPAGDENGKPILISPGYYYGDRCWCLPEYCKVTLLGYNKIDDIRSFNPQFICKSFKAG